MWSEKTRLPVRGRRPRTGSLVFQTTSRLEWWFVILYHITGRTPDLQCIFGNHLKPGLSRPGGPIVRPQVCISNTKTPKSVVQILRPQVRRTNTETSGQHFNYWDLRSAIQILSSYQCGGSVPTENIWKVKRKVKVKLRKSSYASVGSWQWKWKEVPVAFMMKSSEISNENVSCGHTTLKMDNMDMLANIVQLLSGRSGGSWTWSSPFLACRWPPLESHFALSCFIFTIPLSSVALPSSRILGPVDQNIPQNWQIQSYSPD